MIHILQLIPFSPKGRDSCSSKWQLFHCYIVSGSELAGCCESGARISMTRVWFFLRKGVRLLLMMAILSDLRRLSLGLVCQSPWRFALCYWKNACTCRGQRLTQSCEALSSVLSGFIVSSLLIFPDIFLELAFSLENEISIKSLSRKMLVL